MATPKEKREKITEIVNKLIQNESLRARSSIKLASQHVSDYDKEFINVAYTYATEKAEKLSREYMEALNDAIPDEEKEDSESISQK